MRLMKKIATLGLVGVMAMGQCMSAFAATYTVSRPVVTHISSTGNKDIALGLTCSQPVYMLVRGVVIYRNSSGKIVSTGIGDSTSSSKSVNFVGHKPFKSSLGTIVDVTNKGYASTDLSNGYTYVGSRSITTP